MSDNTVDDPQGDTPAVDGAQDARGSGEDRGSPPNLFTK
jgi:hypothetical protein